jgi:hypothetical protein
MAAILPVEGVVVIASPESTFLTALGSVTLIRLTVKRNS